MSFAAIFAFLSPILLSTLKEFLPIILRNILTNIFNPPSAKDLASVKLDEALAKGELTELGKINQVVIEKNGQDKLTKDDLNGMLGLVQ